MDGITTKMDDQVKKMLNGIMTMDDITTKMVKKMDDLEAKLESQLHKVDGKFESQKQ